MAVEPRSPSRLARVPSWALSVVFILAAVGLYARTLSGWFLSDDLMIGAVLPDGQHVDWDHVRRTFRTDWLGGSHMGYYRPLVVLSQAVDASIWGLNPFGYHLTNVVLCGISAFLLFRLAESLGMTRTTALLAGGLFLVHPLHPESVAWISGRTDVLATVFIMATLVAHRRRREGAPREAYWAAIFCALSFLSKEIAIVLPIIVVLMDLIFPMPLRTHLGRIQRALPMWSVYGSISLVYVAIRLGAIGTTSARGHADYFEAWAEPDALKGLAHSLFLLTTPVSRVQVAPSEHGWLVAFAVAGVLSGVAAAVAVAQRRLRLAVPAFAVAAFVTTQLPFLPSLRVVDDLMSSRLLYLGTAWVSLGLGALIGSAPKALAAAVGLGYVLLYATSLQVNLTPWAEAGAIMRRLNRQYAEAFGRYAGEIVEQLPRVRKGAYLALYPEGAFAYPFVQAPPQPRAVAALRAIYEPDTKSLAVLPDVSHGAASRLKEELQSSDWVWSPESDPFKDARFKNVSPFPTAGSDRGFSVASADSWVELDVPKQAPEGNSARETLYLLIRRTPDEDAPTIWWVTDSEPYFGWDHILELRPDLHVEQGRVVPTTIDGFQVYSEALETVDEWPGIKEVTKIRLVPMMAEGRAEVRFFGIALRERPTPRPTVPVTFPD